MREALLRSRGTINDIVREKRSISPEMAKDKVAKQASRISPHPHSADGTLQPV
jgi:plasmid maintenance system antidote protein VapI